MKNVLTLAAVLIGLSACDVYVVEPRYDARDRFTGYYQVEEYSNTYDDYTYYSFNVYKDGYNASEIIISNFYAANIKVYAYVDGYHITIPYQVVNGYEIEGTGSLSGNDLFMDYSVNDLTTHTYTDFCDTHAWIE